MRPCHKCKLPKHLRRAWVLRLFTCMLHAGWARTHATRPTLVELTEEERQELWECFCVLDEKGKGKEGLGQQSVASLHHMFSHAPKCSFHAHVLTL